MSPQSRYWGDVSPCPICIDAPAGDAKDKTLMQKRFCARMTLSQSLMVADGALKLDYASVIFVDPGVQIHKT